MDDLLFDIYEVWPPSKFRALKKLRVEARELLVLHDKAIFSRPKNASNSLGMASERVLESTKEDAKSHPPPWSVGFSRRFKKDTEGMDRKMMGRILEVLEEMTDYGFPFRAKGDTFKPLVGELGGCWRYRLGDSRLIIQPEVDRAQINAIAFAARGSVYE